MFRNFSGKLGAKFLATTLSYSMARTARLNDGFSQIFELEASPVQSQSLQQKDKNRRKRKGLEERIAAPAQAKVLLNMTLVERKSCCLAVNAFLE